MKLVGLLCCLIFASCAQKPVVVTPKTPSPHATASIAKGKIVAYAVKTITEQDVCIVINLKTKGLPQDTVLTYNWMAAVVDQKSQFHLLTLNQRDPASVPQGKRRNWRNVMRTCASRARLADVKKLVLTPKALPFNNEEELQLIWE